MSSNIVQLFNEHFIEFVNEICNVFPHETELVVAKNSLIAIKKVNPKMIIKIWNTYIVSKYQSEIENGNLDFFINKDYSSDLNHTNNSDKILTSINRLRDPIKRMKHHEQEKTMKYIQNLTKLALLFK